MYKSHVIRHFVTAANVATILGIHESAVSQWKDLIPKLRALELEKLTNGALKVDMELYRKVA